jgi:hypothetical protein
MTAYHEAQFIARPSDFFYKQQTQRGRLHVASLVSPPMSAVAQLRILRPAMLEPGRITLFGSCGAVRIANLHVVAGFPGIDLAGQITHDTLLRKKN